jgi:LmbE family N-acetylglucosaminyl deacetylase
MNGIRKSEPVVVISPHLGDAVFACGQLLADHPGSVVVTALAGRPPVYRGLSLWDAAAGFRAGDDVVAARRAEDRAGLGVLGARPVWLDLCERQYDRSPALVTLVPALEAAVVETGLSAVFVPLGLFHSDHALTHAAALVVMRRQPERRWFGYEEPNYRRVPNLLAKRLAALRGAGVAARFAGSSAAEGGARKRQAVDEYRSQLRALSAPGYPGYDDVFAAEWYWRLELLPAVTGCAAERAARWPLSRAGC